MPSIDKTKLEADLIGWIEENGKDVLPSEAMAFIHAARLANVLWKKIVEKVEDRWGVNIPVSTISDRYVKWLTEQKTDDQ